ncbi:hypothetical protein B5K11_26745 [Rhizobium leguminosarum bv. trifolii]|uniref:hypothetical protein n=1 Tax=Rhizobium leguminosarum TaxID=384 RepID=UPI000E2E931D|nr:hypothetical protein [Rhizobium leguminosarum]RFB87540.1 hypothetical protein B5K11_26745 [Rhizobium leguminosarum bv. trifolii]
MASPWKFLSRLISPGREQKRENASADAVTPEAFAVAGPTQTPAEESVNSANRPASEELTRHGQAGPISVGVHSETETENGGRDKLDREDAKIVEAADPAMSGGAGIDITAGHAAAKVKRGIEVAPRKQRSRGKEAVAIAKGSQVFQSVLVEDEIYLDEEIRLLRGQLVGKLKLQNAQLRKMLERFEG